MTTTWTIAAICDAIEGKLDDAAGIAASQSYDELTEGAFDVPLLQVYFESAEPARGQGGQITYRSFELGAKDTRVVIHADILARIRSQLDLDMSKVVEMADAILTVLHAQGEGGWFGLSYLQDLSWRAERLLFQYGDVQIAGIRFVLTVRVY